MDFTKPAGIPDFSEFNKKTSRIQGIISILLVCFDCIFFCRNIAEYNILRRKGCERSNYQKFYLS